MEILCFFSFELVVQVVSVAYSLCLEFVRCVHSSEAAKTVHAFQHNASVALCYFCFKHPELLLTLQ